MRAAVLATFAIAALVALTVRCGGVLEGPANPIATGEYEINLQTCDAKARAMRAEAGADSGWYEAGLQCLWAEHEKHCGPGGDWLDAGAGVCDGGILPAQQGDR